MRICKADMTIRNNKKKSPFWILASIHSYERKIELHHKNSLSSLAYIKILLFLARYITHNIGDVSQFHNTEISLPPQNKQNFSKSRVTQENQRSQYTQEPEIHGGENEIDNKQYVRLYKANGCQNNAPVEVHNTWKWGSQRHLELHKFLGIHLWRF